MRAAADLLMRRPPRAGQTTDATLIGANEDALQAGRGIVTRLDRTVLAMQGPPGAGKTYTAARMIVEALRAGKRVGITATSHKVIAHLLGRVCDVAAEEGVVVRGIQKANEGEACAHASITRTSNPAAVRPALDNGEANVAAGTAWLWSREDMVGAVDLLFVDEAGQFSLANALAVAPAASSLVLVGDPQQLQQPLKGVHPPGVEVSALDHLLGDASTIAPDRGLFLPLTWRLHPELCAFTSSLFYDGRLTSRDGLERQTIRGVEPVIGSGLRLVAVDHEGNQSESPEEVDVVRRLFVDASNATWIDAGGVERPLRVADILVISPYNVQVAALRAKLPPGARVGTVDKFQGQEAPVVIYSMTTSSPEDAPRGMEFLYSLNRLNVATSRAKCLAIVVASPRLFAPECRTPAKMRLANAFCALEERVRSRDVSLKRAVSS
jgi:uncharacterized protein